MLCHPEVMTQSEQLINVSAGTAGVLGLQRIRQADVPTTAYLMVGEHCRRDCAFCTQARSSAARAHFLSRIVWPPYPLERALHAVAYSFAQHKIARCCLQVTVFPGYLSQTLALVQRLRALCDVPLSVSVVLSDIESIRALFESGVERVTLALDAACERVYRETKGSDWQRRLAMLRAAAQLFPNRIGTHLIVGLGETEQEMVSILQRMLDWGITVGLFAFTPVPGTACGSRPPPSLLSYRRIQAARYLLAAGACRVEDFRFSATGQLTSYGLNGVRLHELLADGSAFQTAGCPGCNRPYYNERPGKIIYNYPRPLHSGEIEAAIASVIAELACE